MHGKLQSNTFFMGEIFIYKWGGTPYNCRIPLLPEQRVVRSIRGGALPQERDLKRTSVHLKRTRF
jgi:hypothetical protein